MNIHITGGREFPFDEAIIWSIQGPYLQKLRYCAYNVVCVFARTFSPLYPKQVRELNTGTSFIIALYFFLMIVQLRIPLHTFSKCFFPTMRRIRKNLNWIARLSVAHN